MSKCLLGIKLISCFFILILLFVSCTLVIIRLLFGEDGGLAWVIHHFSLIKSYPLTTYIKEIILGIVCYIFLSYIALRYWKISIVGFLLAITFIWGKWYLFHKDSSMFSREYIMPNAYIPDNLSKKNIIVISLESFENIFAIDDLTKSGNLIPNLSSLKNEGVTFDGYIDMLPMRPTIPSFFAKNCGIQSRTDDMDIFNNMAKSTNYTQFPNAKCVSDILNDNGYSTYYIEGAKLTDEGASFFFEQHHVDMVMGRMELLKKGVSQLKSTYMIPDSEIYKYAQKILSTSQKHPFGLYIITGNTHGAHKGDYYIEDGCRNTYNDYRGAIQCLDEITYDFIKWCQSQPWYKDTVIYLIGDHLMRPSELGLFSDDAKKFPRQVYTLMLNGNLTTNKIKREYTQVDFAPTFLESLGFVCPALGLGRSLFRKEATLVEKLGKNELEAEIKNSQIDFQNIIHGKTFSINKEEPAVSRIDIQTKLVDAAKSQFDIYVDDSKTPEEQANWMPKYGSQGYVVQKEGYSMVLNIKSYLNGKIRLTLRGKERRPNGVDPVPVWVTYTSLKINDKEVLTSPETVWLSEGYEYNIEAKAGEEYKIHVEWQKPDKIPEK